MTDDKTLRSMMEAMESAAEDAVRDDPAFYKTLRSLKAEVDLDPQVQSIVSRLHAAGSSVFSSLVPRIKIRVRTNSGEVTLADDSGNPADPASPIAHLTQELRSAVFAVLKRGGYREALDQIMNDAVRNSGRFEGIAAELEKAGHEIVICLNLSPYAKVRKSTGAIVKTNTPRPSAEPLTHLLSRQDLKFLKDLKISASEN